MNRDSIGGTLTMAALQALHGGPHRETNRDADRMQHFHSLDRAQQAEAIRRMAATGASELSIAAATQLSVEFIRHVLAERGTP